MTTTPMGDREKVANEIERILHDAGTPSALMAKVAKPLQRLRTPFDQSRDGELKPVAWRWRATKFNEWHYVAHEPRPSNKGAEVEPLYTRPTPVIEGREGREKLALALLKRRYPHRTDLDRMVTNFIDCRPNPGAFSKDIEGAFWDADVAITLLRPSPAIGGARHPMFTAPKDRELIGIDSDDRVFNLRWEPDDCGENWYDVHGDQLAYPVAWMSLPP
jgi:hypothetical protein